MGSKRPETDSEVFWGKQDPQGPPARRLGWPFGLGRGRSKAGAADDARSLPPAGGRAARRQTGYIDYADVTLAHDEQEPDAEPKEAPAATTEQTVDPDKVVLPERLMQVAMGKEGVPAGQESPAKGDAPAGQEPPAKGEAPAKEEVPAEEKAHPSLIVRVEPSPQPERDEEDAAVVVAMGPKASDRRAPDAKPDEASDEKAPDATAGKKSADAEPDSAPAAGAEPAPASGEAPQSEPARERQGRHFSDAMAAPGRDNDDADLAEDEIAQLKARAEGGDRAAMRSLGNRYQAGNGVPKDYGLMREWWERAAQAGNTTAMWDLGYYYLIGKYLDQDVARGVAWFNLAIENGNADAAFQLALCYGTGMFVEKSYDTARKYFTQALRLGREDAQDEIDECDRMLQEGTHASTSAGPRGGNIVLSHVSRSFGRKKVLDDISLTIKGGELVAIVGSSGGGKSTLGSIILGTLRPSKGRVVFDGSFGFVPQQNLVHQNLRVRQQLEFYARAVKHLPAPKAKERIDWVMRELELTGVAKSLIRKCSGGEKRRVSVACELLSYPDGLLLDEPTSGLDPGDSGNLVAVLHALVHDERMSCLVINHDYENIQLFDKICFLANGKVCFYGTPDKLFEYFDTRSTREIYTLMDKDPLPFIRRFEEWRRDHPDSLGGMC